jgi:hypothetical protein
MAAPNWMLPGQIQRSVPLFFHSLYKEEGEILKQIL